MKRYSGIELIDIARQLEKCGEAFYEAAAESLRHSEVRELVRWLQKEETRHSVVFEQVLADLEESSELWRLDDDYLSWMRSEADGRVFPDPDAARAAVSKLKTEEDVLRTALEFEQQSIRFFRSLRKMVSVEDYDKIDALITEEQSHVAAIAGLLQRRLAKASR